MCVIVTGVKVARVVLDRKPRPDGVTGAALVDRILIGRGFDVDGSGGAG